ncbi:hypothetical protein VTI74DRAFT_4812 [Chaetomium olivicolor]
MGLLPLSYRRPAYVEKSECTGSQTSLHSNGASGGSLEPVGSGSSGEIPLALSFDRIMDGGTCPPCTLRDFMNYLIYVERSAENLQFFLWYRDYARRFRDAKTADLALAPEWTQAMEDEAVARIKKEHADKVRRPPSRDAAAIFKGTDFEKAVEGGTRPGTDNLGSQASQAFAAAGVKAPFTIQPFRREVDRVITTYIMDGAPRQLNLSDHEQKAVLQALSFTTHPSAFRQIAKTTEATLRQQAHPNFIRWSICNGNPARVTFARGLGIGMVLVGVVVASVLTLSKAGRGYRALAAIPWLIGFATFMAGYKGMCVLLHGVHHRHIRPWELFVSALDNDHDDESAIVPATKSSFDSFGSGNSYEEEPWVVKYQKRNVVRKIFDRQVWIEEPALRRIQDTIFVQSVLFALVCAGVLTAVFVAVPGGGFF